MPTIPSALDEVVATWNCSGIDFQRILIEMIVELPARRAQPGVRVES
jgi:hypothetical protein